jgi:hypothetical protein
MLDQDLVNFPNNQGMPLDFGMARRHDETGLRPIDRRVRGGHDPIAAPVGTLLAIPQDVMEVNFSWVIQLVHRREDRRIFSELADARIGVFGKREFGVSMVLIVEVRDRHPEGRRQIDQLGS